MKISSRAPSKYIYLTLIRWRKLVETKQRIQSKYFLLDPRSKIVISLMTQMKARGYFLVLILLCASLFIFLNVISEVMNKNNYGMGRSWQKMVGNYGDKFRIYFIVGCKLSNTLLLTSLLLHVSFDFLFCFNILEESWETFLLWFVAIIRSPSS